MLFKLNIHPQKLKSQAAFTLLEITIVVLIIGVMVVVMAPDISSTDSTQLDLAAEQYAAAIRFSRSESMRTVEPHGFSLRNVNRDLKIKRVDDSTDPWVFGYDINNPVSKKLYHVKLDEILGIDHIKSTHSYSFRGTCNTVLRVYFDSRGSAWCLDPAQVGLDQYDITLSIGSNSRTVSIDGITGRVSIL